MKTGLALRDDLKACEGRTIALIELFDSDGETMLIVSFTDGATLKLRMRA